MKSMKSMIHKFELGGIKLVLDVNSGAVHIIDDIVWDLLEYGPDFNRELIYKELGKKYMRNDLAEALDEIMMLIEEDMLYSNWNVNIPFHSGEPVIKAMCLHAAHDCNLRCSYCFASTGDFKGGRSLLDLDTGKNALDFLVKKSGNRKNLEVDFFGGEPLMNLDVIKELVRYGRSLEKRNNKRFKFTITTNGVLLDKAIIKYLNDEFVNVVISLDGRPKIHNKMRKTVNGKGSYDVILENAKSLVNGRKQKDYYIRGTFTRNNLDFYKDVLHLADCGFEQISIEPVVASEEEDYSIREEDLPQIFESYEILASEYIKRRRAGKWFNFFHFFIDLNQGPCIAKRLIGCGAGNEYVAVTPQGDIYPCHQFVGQTKFKMGNVNNNTFDINLQRKFRDNNLLKKDICQDCWAKFYCTGGCTANSYNFTGTLDSPYQIGCEMEKKRIECALMIKAVESIEY